VGGGGGRECLAKPSSITRGDTETEMSKPHHSTGWKKGAPRAMRKRNTAGRSDVKRTSGATTPPIKERGTPHKQKGVAGHGGGRDPPTIGKKRQHHYISVGERRYIL